LEFDMRSYDPALIEGLRGRIRDLERSPAGSVLSLAPEIDAHLPNGGLAQGTLHEILAADPGPATLFAAAILRAVPGPLLWCRRGQAFDAGSLCPAGLAAIGLDPRRLLLVNTRQQGDALWAMEEGLRARVTVIGELADVPLIATRRLALAAENSGALALVLRRDEPDPAPSAATTRWRIAAASSQDGLAQLRAELFRCRGAAPATWLMEWHDETRRFVVSAALHDRAADPAQARLAG
jgi:protein ImuA